MSDVMSFLGSAPSEVKEIEFRKKPLTIRALTAHESERLQNVHPRPRAPHARQPGTHPEKGPLFVNEQDATFRMHLESWLRKSKALEVAASCGWSVGGAAFSATMAADALTGWAKAMLAAVLGESGGAGALNDAELGWLWNQVKDLSDPYGQEGDRIETAKKALSVLSRSEAMDLIALLFPSTTASQSNSCSGGPASG